MRDPATLVSVEEYLSSSYDPDVDYVDGELEDRNVGELDHSDLQTELANYFRNRRREWGCHVFVEQRVQIRPNRYRIPDICVVLGSRPTDQILRTPPFLCIEILSPEDRMSRMQVKISDYLNFGVSSLWVIDPEARTAFIYDVSGMREVKDGLLTTSRADIVVPVGGVFSALDEP